MSITERVKVAKWNAGKVKIALDDALKDAIQHRGYVEDFSATDLRLGLTFLAILVSGYGLYFRYGVQIFNLDVENLAKSRLEFTQWHFPHVGLRSHC